jgi:hypothetical protein
MRGHPHHIVVELAFAVSTLGSVRSAMSQHIGPEPATVKVVRVAKRA